MSNNLIRTALEKNRVIAHRGAKAYMPENTLSAFAAAAKMGAEFVELDVMLSKDGIPMVFHDETLDRMTNGLGLFDEKSYKELSLLKITESEKIPTLDETLSLIFANHLKVNIEIKPSRKEFARETALKTLDVVKNYNAKINDSIIFSSFDKDSLYTLRQQSEELALGILMDDNEYNWQDYLEKIKPISIHISDIDANLNAVKNIKEKNLLSLVYTVNQKERAYELFDYGVNCIFSDYPNLLNN